MNLESLQARALSRSLHDLSVAPEPLPIKRHRRQRSASDGQTFVSTAIVPATDSTEILSSLISSLTVLSDSAREQLRQAKDFQNTISNRPSSVDQDSSFAGSRLRTTEHNQRGIISGETSDQETAEPPVVGYARGRPRTTKKVTREKWAVHKSTKSTQSGLSRQKSSQTLTQPKSNVGIGIPSIERPATAIPSVSRPASKATSRGASIDTLRAGDSTAKSSLKMLFSLRAGDDNPDRKAPTKEADGRSIKSVRSGKFSSQPLESDKENHIPDAKAVTTPEDSAQMSSVILSSPGNKPTYNPLDPSNRDDLGEHLIPSRKSSLRHRPGTASSHGRSSVVSKLHSMGSRDIKSSGAETEITEEEDSTLRRIRELQRAREKRHTEWSSDSKKPDGGSKRSYAIGGQRRRGSSTKGFRKPSTTDLSETPEDKEIPKMPTSAMRTDIETGPTSKDTATTQLPSPISPILSSFHPARTSSITRSGTLGRSSSPPKHRRTFSSNLGRLSPSKSRSSDEMKNVSEQVETFLTAPRLTQRLRHPRTGRTIAFSEVGHPDGFVVLVCVGMGLTRYVTSFYDDVARTQNLRLITPDRPGIGESSAFPDGNNTPLAWADDVAVICHALNIQKFSLLAHSAGTIYALAIALKMPTYIRGRIHLLAPWIPPSQMVASKEGKVKPANLPTSHKILSMLPAPFLRAANSRFLSANAASIESKSGRKKDRSKSNAQDVLANEIARDLSSPPVLSPDSTPGRDSVMSIYETPPKGLLNRHQSPPASPSTPAVLGSSRKATSPMPPDARSPMTPEARAALYNTILTHRTWALAITNANPATDLIVCLERRRPIGFFYGDVIRSVGIHHGRHDSRGPREKARWLETVMRRCELRVIEDEGHSLMSSAKVMSEVLAEVGREWEEWEIVANHKERRKRDREAERQNKKIEDQTRFARTGRY